MKSVAILQSNYIPWKGYFDLIASVDTFIIYDDMQYTRRDWRNRNKIKTDSGLKWLTIPVEVKGKYHQKINETLIADDTWAKKHWQNLQQNYKNSPYFDDIAKWLEPLYSNMNTDSLSMCNTLLITEICEYLGIETAIQDSRDFTLAEGKSERLANLCQQVSATEYISGPAAKDYLDEAVFDQLDINVKWFDYSDYPAYDQQHGEFEHFVTILDLLFNTGKNAVNYMKYVK